MIRGFLHELGRARPQDQRRSPARCRPRPGSAARRRDRRRDGQHSMLRPLHRYRRRRHLPEHLARRRRLARACAL